MDDNKSQKSFTSSLYSPNKKIKNFSNFVIQNKEITVWNHQTISSWELQQKNNHLWVHETRNRNK